MTGLEDWAEQLVTRTIETMTARPPVQRATYTPAEAAVVLGISEETIRRRCADGTITTISADIAGPKHLIPASVLERILTPASTTLNDPQAEASRQLRPTLSVVDGAAGRTDRTAAVT